MADEERKGRRPAGPAAERRARLAAAMRANLKRRKDRQRAKDAAAAEADAAADAEPVEQG